MRVLLIEDDALLRTALAESLIESGIEPDALSNAEDALILLGAGQVPDVLVTDIDLGSGLSGFDLMDIARNRHPDVAVILISGAPPAPDMTGPGRHARFLRKPFRPEELVAAILEAGRRGGGEAPATAGEAPAFPQRAAMPRPEGRSSHVDKDRIEGAGKQVKGAVKEGLGSLTGDEKMKAEGKADKAEGKVQNTVGGIKDSAREALDKNR